MAEPLDPELIKDGFVLLQQRAADILVSNEVKTIKVTEPVETALDAAYFALIRAGFEPKDLATVHSRLKYRLSGAIQRRADKQAATGVDHQG